MTIARPIFFVATSALAVGACQVYVSSEPPKTAAATPPPAVHPPAPATTAGHPPAQGGTGGTTPVRPIPVHLAHFGGGSAPAPSGGGSTPSPPPSGCLDADATTVPACSSLPAADSSCSSNTVPQQKCAAYTAYFDPKVAAAAISCMGSMSSKQLCDATQATNCAHTALGQACPDSTVSQLCGIAATSCHTSTTDCTSMLSGLNDQGKQQVAQCIAQGCNSGLQACVDALAAH